MKEMILAEIEEHQMTLQMALQTLQPIIEMACKTALETIQSGNKILLCGNGGSAADAQHIAAELVGRYKNERPGLPAIALTTDTSTLTSIANDFSFDNVFSRQVEALARPGDLLIGISTSGKSANVIKALEKARHLKCRTIGFSGRGGGQLNGTCDLNIVIPSNETARIQEMHILVGHIICRAVDDALSE